jgi:hypothetical protein
VVVGLREATLILTDPKTEMPLAQWSLPAILRLNPGKMPAIYAPGDEPGEELEMDDPDMVNALETVHRAVERRKPHPGRLRGVVLGATALGVVAMVVFWLPEQIKAHTAGVLPAPTRAKLGDMALSDLSRLTGSPCKSVPGKRAAANLAARLFPSNPPRIEVLREGLTTPGHLPGNILLLPASLIEGADGPDIVAGHLLDEQLRADATDPVDPLLGQLGLGGTLRLLTTGSTLPDALAGFGEAYLARPRPAAPSQSDLLAAFQAAGVSSAAYGYAQRSSSGATQGLISDDPFPLGAPAPVMTDENWLELQAICNQ